MQNKVTAVIITGTSEEVSSLLNNSFHKLTNVKFLVDTPTTPKVKYKYKRPTRNNSYARLTNNQAKAVNKFLNLNSAFKYTDLVSYLETKDNIFLPSNAAISNHLNRSNYIRHQNVLFDNTSYYTWEKDD